jgi:hypothetical protein
MERRKKTLNKVRSAARQQVGKLFIIAACIALLVCNGYGCGCGGHHKRTYVYTLQLAGSFFFLASFDFTSKDLVR